MANSPGTSSTVVVQRLLDLLEAGDPHVSRQLIEVTTKRLHALSGKILADIPGVGRWEEIDDLLQNSSLRLWRALEKHHPKTPLDYFRLAAALIRRELIDLSRHYFGPYGIASNQHQSWRQEHSSMASPVQAVGNSTFDPVKLSHWTEFHEYVESLPEEQRTLFDLLWYQGLTLQEAADSLGTSERTVRRRWRLARLAIYRDLLDESEDQRSSNPDPDEPRDSV